MSNAVLTTAKQIRSEVLFLVKHHRNEIKKEIEQEFAEVLRNNIINPYEENIVLYGKNFAFKFAGVTRFKHTVHLKFDVYRRNEAIHQHEKYDHTIGKIIVVVKVRE